MPDWTGLIEPVALALLGPPNARLSSRIRGDLRFGNKGSLSVRIPPHRDAGRWKNYEEGTGGGVLDLIADRTGSGRAGAVSWLERNGLALDKLSPKPPPEAPGRKRPTQADDPVAAALRLWASAHPIPADPLHPGRCWLDRRFLWPPGLAPPNQVRWIPGNTGWARNAAGCICVPADQPSEWERAWPQTPRPSGIQRIPVAQDGTPAGDKRSRGNMQGKVLILGNPRLESAASPVLVCEGAADALALACREPGPVVATLGTAGMHSASELPEWLATAPHGAEIWADRDTGKNGRAPRPG